MYFAIAQKHNFRVITKRRPVEISVGFEKEVMSSVECSELDTTSTVVILFNNGYVVRKMDTSCMMDDNTLQMTI